MSNFDDSITDYKRRVRVFNRLSNRQNWTHVAKDTAKSKRGLESLDLVEIVRLVVKSSNLDPCRSNLDEFEFSIEKHKTIVFKNSMVFANH